MTIGCLYLSELTELDLRCIRLREHILTGHWGHKNTKASRRALNLLIDMGYMPICDKYLRGAHRLVREAQAEYRRMSQSRAGKGEP